MNNVLYLPIRVSERIAKGRGAIEEKKENALKMLVAVVWPRSKTPWTSILSLSFLHIFLRRRLRSIGLDTYAMERWLHSTWTFLMHQLQEIFKQWAGLCPPHGVGILTSSSVVSRLPCSVAWVSILFDMGPRAKRSSVTVLLNRNPQFLQFSGKARYQSTASPSLHSLSRIAHLEQDKGVFIWVCV